MRKPIPQIIWAIIFANLNGEPWASWYSASAQNVLPIELQGQYMMSTIMMHFCADGGDNCNPIGGLRYICCGGSSNQCSIDTERPMCMEDDQVYNCSYRDAIVCQYKDRRGSCIYSNSSSIQPLCVCKDNGTWPTSDNQTSQIRGSCKGNETTMYPWFVGKGGGHGGEVNYIAIVLGTIMVLFLLVLLVVGLLKRKRNQRPPKKATTNPTNSSSVSSADRAQMPDPAVLGGTEHNYANDHWPQRNPAFDPGKPKPANRYEENEQSRSGSITAAKSPETREVPKYYELRLSNDGQKGGETPQGPKYYELGQASNDVTCGKTPQAPKYDEVRRRPHTEQRNNEKTSQDPTYFVLEHPQGNDAETMFIEVVASANPSPGEFSNQGYDQANTPLQQIAKPAESGYEPLKLPTSAAERNDDASSPYDHLNIKTGIRSQQVELPEKKDNDQYASLNV